MSSYPPKPRSARPRAPFRPAPAPVDSYLPSSYDDHNSSSRVPRRYPPPQVPPPPPPEYIYTEIRMSQNPSPVGHLSEINSQDEEYFQQHHFDMDQGMGIGHDHLDLDRDRLAVVPTRPVAPSPSSDRLSVGSGHGKSRKGRSNQSSSTVTTKERERHTSHERASDSRGSRDQSKAVPTERGLEPKVRVSDTLKSHSSKPQALRSSPFDSTQPLSHKSRGERPKSKLNQSTKFDTPSESGKSSHHGSTSRPSARSWRDDRIIEPMDVGSPLPKQRFKRPLETRDRDRHDVPKHKSESMSAGLPGSGRDGYELDLIEPISMSTRKPTTTNDILQLSDIDDDDDDLLSSSDIDLVESRIHKTEEDTKKVPGKLQLDMPRSLDHVLKKIIGPMIKKVVTARTALASEASDQWEWTRLDVLGQEMESAMSEAKRSIQGVQQLRHNQFEEAKNKRIEYETHTTGVYKDYGKDYRVLCNDLTGNNNRAVKKIKREIRGDAGGAQRIPTGQSASSDSRE